MDYGTFSLLVSLADVAVYAVLLGIAARREQWLRRHPTHVRALLLTQSPALLVLFSISMLLLVISLTLGHSDLAELMRLATATMRGIILAFGLWLFGWYLTVRRTWL